MSRNWPEFRWSSCAGVRVGATIAPQREEPLADDRLESLKREARQLVAEIAAARQSFRAGGRPDCDVFARMSRCYDRLDDIADRIGLTLVTLIANEAGIGLRR